MSCRCGKSVPEPSTWVTLLLGLAGIGTMYRRSEQRIVAIPAACLDASGKFPTDSLWPAVTLGAWGGLVFLAGVLLAT